MKVDLAQELLNELGSSLENLETQQAALLQFLKDKEMLTDDQLVPYLAQAGKASSVRWRAAHIRLESLFRAERQEEEKLREKEQYQTGAGQAPPIQTREAETQKHVGGANAELQSEKARVNGAAEGAGEQSISEKNDKQGEHAPGEDKKSSPTTKTS